MTRLSKPAKLLLLFVCSLMFFAESLWAGEGSPVSISWGFLIIGLLGGLAFFLYGIEKMSDGLKKAAGNKMR
ncbi:MAG: hypothetical protein JRJ46_07935, partial [Deltaproteobacteria bacterium]|nr:hypothetical protein [Deltaproteobacteria bacterium]